MEWLSDLINGAILIIVALIEYRATRARKQQKKDSAQMERRAARRAEESRISMQYMDAILEFSIATAIAVENGEVNGEMKKARAKATTVKDTYDDFITRMAAEQVAKI